MLRSHCRHMRIKSNIFAHMRPIFDILEQSEEHKFQFFFQLNQGYFSVTKSNTYRMFLKETSG